MVCWQPWSKREDPDNEPLEPWDVDDEWSASAMVEQERIADLEDDEEPEPTEHEKALYYAEFGILSE